jgi:hypothetical protein
LSAVPARPHPGFYGFVASKNQGIPSFPGLYNLRNFFFQKRFWTGFESVTFRTLSPDIAKKGELDETVESSR